MLGGGEQVAAEVAILAVVVAVRVAIARAVAGPSYFERLADSRTATLTLVDSARRPIGRLTFDLGSALTEAREALRATPWTCAAPTPAPEPAAQFHLAP